MGYVEPMAPRVVRVQLDEESERALSALTREVGDESEAIHVALVEAGARRRRRAALAEQVRRLSEDPADTAERESVLADMDAVASDWPA